MSRSRKSPPEAIARSIVYILYQAWVEARCRSSDSQRIFDLADTMHDAPALLVNFGEDWLDYFREDLRRYCEKYPSAPPYLAYLEGSVPDDSQWLWLRADDEKH